MVPIYNFNGALSDNNNLLDDLGDGSRYDTLFILSFHNKAIQLNNSFYENQYNYTN